MCALQCVDAVKSGRSQRVDVARSSGSIFTSVGAPAPEFIPNQQTNQQTLGFIHKKKSGVMLEKSLPSQVAAQHNTNSQRAIEQQSCGSFKFHRGRGYGLGAKLAPKISHPQLSFPQSVESTHSRGTTTKQRKFGRFCVLRTLQCADLVRVWPS